MEINGTSGADTLNGTPDADVIRGLEGNDVLDGLVGADQLYGGDGDDELHESGAGDWLYGEAGNDILTIHAGAFLLDGGTGDDVFNIHLGGSTASALGGEGNDRFNVYSHLDQDLTGGAGQDYFWFEHGLRSTITDFQPGAGGDRLDVATFYDKPEFGEWNGVGDLFELGFAALTDSDSGVILWFDRDGGADSLVPYLFLPGADPLAFTADNFVGMSPTVVHSGPPVNGQMQGGWRNDLFTGGAGAHIEAGLGEDGVSYQGALADYDFAYGNGSWYVVKADPAGGATMVDRLDEVERARFGEGDVEMLAAAPTGGFSLPESMVGTVAATPGGGFMLVWTDAVEVLFQFYDAAGTALGNPRAAFEGGTAWSYGADVAYLADGGFVLVSAALDGGADGVIGRVFEADGTPRGAEFIVNSAIAGNQRKPDIAALAGGGFVVGWQTENGLSTGQLFTASGAKTGPEFVIGSGAHPATGDVALAPLADGGFAAFWLSNGDAYVRRFGSDGQPVGDGYKVSSTALDGFIGLESATLADGRVMLVWEDGYDIWARAFDPAGDTLGDTIKVNVTSLGRIPSIAVFDDGSFVIGWEQNSSFGRKTVAQRYDNAGERVGNEVTVSLSEMQPEPKLAALADGSFVATFQEGTFNPVFTMGVGVAIMSAPAVADHGSGAVQPPGSLSARAGTEGADQLGGTPGDDVIDGRGGGDHLVAGQGGNDVVLGGGGNDVLVIDWSGVAGAISLRDGLAPSAAGGHNGILRVAGGARVEFSGIERFELSGGSAGDVLTGGAGDDIVRGGGGNDMIHSGTGVDELFGDAGNDVFLFGGSMTAADRIDGGAGIDQIALQGDYSGVRALLLGSNMISVENFAILPGNDTRFGDPGTNFYDYQITTQDAAVAAGVQLVVDANRLRAGEDFTFNGSAETDGSFFIYGGGGVDTLIGGAKNDVFIFGGQNQWGASDVVTGGAGIDQLALRGNYTIVFGAGQLNGIEQIGMVSAQDTRYGALGSSYSYDLTMNDANVDGIQFTVDAAPLRPGETLTFDGSAEDDGSFRVFGGRGNDSIAGSRNGDVIAGRLGRDAMTGNGGADTFRFDLAEESAPGAADHILDFTPGTDKIDLSRIDANTQAEGNQAFTWIGSNAFGANGAASAGQLRIYESNGSWFVEGDTDGNGAADFVLQLTLAGPTALGQGDFLL